MDQPPVHYARTDDGVNIAYWTLGEGDPIVWLNDSSNNHSEVEWDSPWHRRWYETLGGECRLVKFDPRGTGLSDRAVEDFSLPARTSDIDAVVEALGLERFALTGFAHAGPVAMQYALDHPRRLSHLILQASFARTRDYYDAPVVRAMGSLSAASWDSFIQAGARNFLGWDCPNAAGFANVWRASIEQEAVIQFHRVIASVDLSERLDEIGCPTLVLHHAESPTPELTRQLAAGIPSATLRIIPGFVGEHFDQEWAAVAEFLGFSRRSPPSEAFRAILFTDVVASTPLLAQLKDAKMREVMHDHDAVLQAAVDEHGGRVVKEIGDAFFAEFAVPSAAVACAIAMQRGIQAQFVDTDVPLRLRIGINAGEPIAEDDDLHGISVNIAKRLESAAPENGILVSDVVRQAVAGKDFDFVGQGEVKLKGFEEPVRAWSVEWA